MATVTTIVWFRADLRIHDHPALAAALKNSDTVVPVFIFDDKLTNMKSGSANRNRFLLECLNDLKQSLMSKQGNLVIRHGDAATELITLAKEVNAQAVYYTAGYTPYALRRDKKVEDALSRHSITARSFGGTLAVGSVQKLATKNGKPYKVFTPFYNAWLQVERRSLAPLPSSIPLPSGVTLGSLPKLADMSDSSRLSEMVIPGGETEARKRLKAFLDGPIDIYHETNDDLGLDGTSRLSPYLHFGCLSPREIETMLPDSKGAAAWHRQLAWREFYSYVLLHFPHREQEFQERYRAMQWQQDTAALKAWQDGQTGYPVVDAAMRQLKTEGWMHNRARLIVGSFLTKDLGIDWREGESHFMRWLLDGDTANNNGNWQWIASVGVDPAPVFRRLYNPSTQQERFDPQGNYVHKYVPELQNVPNEHLSQPWQMTEDEQKKYNCVIGRDYPAPIVDHKAARQQALERYRSQSAT